MRLVYPVGALMVAWALAGPGAPAQAQDNRAAYGVAVRCFVANVRAENIERRAGRLALAEGYRVSGRQAFDTAVVLGTALGKSRAQMDADLDASQATDLPRMVSDPTYYRGVVQTCRAYGLMPAT